MDVGNEMGAVVVLCRMEAASAGLMAAVPAPRQGLSAAR